MVAQLAGPDHAMAEWPGVTLAEIGPVLAAYQAARKAKDDGARIKVQRDAQKLALRGVKATFARAVGSPDALRERLVAFWADHFTIAPRNRVEAALPAILMDEAIRPHVNGRFGDMLRAVITHPGMLIYLNQASSFGPGSRKGQRRDKGLNENLARELLELHTLGVGASYSQTDVRELAELLTGLTVSPDQGFVFDPARAEPGPETVLGVTYSGKGLAPILRVLDDLAARPETAAHIARKLVEHFVADDPDPALVAAVEAAWRDSGGDLLAVAGALVTHPLAASVDMGKARQPFDFMAASLRALGVAPADIVQADAKSIKRLLLDPLTAMGQPFHQAPGPDGWPERASDWITPQGLAARIDWAMNAPERLVRPLPDPRAFLRQALGSRAGDRLTWAVGAAESARDGVGLVLASPEFNQR
ncbi:MAG: DUF1800 domain-containing protein [Rhodobacteraceae bacterium]|nr:DUF1800 domain-containing protein [Paracoccaceae bacterium]